MGLTAADMVIGNYRVVAELRRGGMGVVYRARHVTMGQDAVVKQLLPQFTTNAEVVQRFFQEARAAAAIDDPGIVRIFDNGVLADGSAYIVMELLRGESLADRLRRSGALAPALAVAFFRQIARAVGAAHGRGIVHRDLKPDNLFLVPDPEVAIGERVKVLDFGIAKFAEQPGMFQTQAAPLGTPAYMPPEQWTTPGLADARTDVYAMGIILFEMLTGRIPFPGPSLPDFLDQHRYAPPPAPGTVDQALAVFDDVVLRALAKAPDDRFPTMDAMVSELPLAGAPPASLDRLASSAPATASSKEQPAEVAAASPTPQAPAPAALAREVESLQGDPALAHHTHVAVRRIVIAVAVLIILVAALRGYLGHEGCSVGGPSSQATEGGQ